MKTRRYKYAAPPALKQPAVMQAGKWWQFSRCENSVAERSVRRRKRSGAETRTTSKVTAPQSEVVAARQLPPAYGEWRRGNWLDNRKGRKYGLNSMKRQRLNLFVILIIFLVGKSFCSSITNFTKSVIYTPPKNFQMHDFSKDEYSNLFTYWGSGIGYEETNGYVGDEDILFMLGPGCFRSDKYGDPMLPRSPADLRDDFDFYYHRFLLQLTNLPPARIGKTAGYTSVSSSTFFTNNNNYYSSCWIQIKSNIVVRVEIQSTSKTSFDAATNSLKTLKINKKEILNIVESSIH